MEGVGQADARLCIIEGGVVLVGLIEQEEPLGLLETLFCTLRRQKTVLACRNLMASLCNELRRLADSLVNLLIECLEVYLLVRLGCRPHRKRKEEI